MAATAETRAALLRARECLQEAEDACRREIGEETAQDLSRVRRHLDTWTGPGMWLDLADASLEARSA